MWRAWFMLGYLVSVVEADLEAEADAAVHSGSGGIVLFGGGKHHLQVVGSPEIENLNDIAIGHCRIAENGNGGLGGLLLNSLKEIYKSLLRWHSHRLAVSELPPKASVSLNKHSRHR